jgi:hypothetical protein
MHVPTATLIGLILAALPIAAIAGIVWITRLAARPIRPVPSHIRLVQQHAIAELRDDTDLPPRRRPARRDHIV